MTTAGDLTLQFPFSLGRGEVGAGLDHPLAAPFRHAIKTGNLPAEVARIILVDDGSDNSPIVLGTFAHTVGDRMLFFPGAPMVLEASGTKYDGRTVDHITLDSESRSGQYESHIAVQEIPDRGLSYKTSPPAEHMIPWFTLAAPDLRGFERLPERLTLHFPAPSLKLLRSPEKLKRFAERLQRQRLEISGPVELPPPLARTADSYVQLDAWAGRWPGWETSKVRVLPWAHKREIAAAGPIEDITIMGQLGMLHFTPTAGMGVIISRPPGRLREPRILRPTLSS